MSRLIFAYVLKGINDEYGTHSKEDGEVVLNTIRKENLFQGTSRENAEMFWKKLALLQTILNLLDF